MSATLGPVSAWLETDLRGWVRRHGLVLWLDLDAHYNGLVEALSAEHRAGRLPYAVHAFRGSHLELMLALEDLAGGLDKPPLVVHLPGFNEDSVRQTPLLELYSAGVRYRKKLATAVTEASAGRVGPERIAAFLEGAGLTLASADAWLAERLAEGSSPGLLSELGRSTPEALLDELLWGGPLSRALQEAQDLEPLWVQLGAWTGLPGAWREALPAEPAERPAEVAAILASWALAVTYTDALPGAPVDPRLASVRALPRAVVEACRALAEHLRERHPAHYRRAALLAEQALPGEVAAAKDAGARPILRFEEERALQAALQALGEAAWEAALQAAEARLADLPFWLQVEPERQAAWELVAAAARLGAALARAGSMRAGSLEGAIKRYIEAGAEVDRAHRILEHRRALLLHPALPQYEALRSRLDELKARTRRWVDDGARSLVRACQAHGWLPGPGLQQRTLFEEVVRELVQEGGPVALFVVEGLRFELGRELYEAMAATPATTLALSARLAELPTVPEVGLNALAPLAERGKLRPMLEDQQIVGFFTGEFRVHDPESRRRAMHDRVGGTRCPLLSLPELLERDATSLKRAASSARLLIVTASALSQDGQDAHSPIRPTLLQELRVAWQRLREAGLRKFIFTADRGFLLDAPARSYTLSPQGEGERSIPLSELGYEGPGCEGMALHLASARPNPSPRAVWGGPTLQERLVPVLTLVHRARPGSDTLSYALVGGPLPEAAGLRRLWARLEIVDQGALSFGGTREVELSLRALAPGAQVLPAMVRGGARLAHGSLFAAAGEHFELFYHLSSPSPLELHHPGPLAEVAPLRIEE